MKAGVGSSGSGGLEEVVGRINGTDGDARGVRLEVFKWETGVVPQIGPKPQDVVDAQMPARYDVYLGIMKHRFGTPTEGYGSGPAEEFQDALKNWGEVGSPWICIKQILLFRRGTRDTDNVCS